MPMQTPVSLSLYILTLIIYALATIIFFVAKKKNNFFDFDSIFISLFSICSFYSTAFYNNSLIYRVLFLGLEFNTDYVNIGNWMSLMALLSYYLGGLSVNPKKSVKEREINIKPIRTRNLGYCLMGMMILFYLLGGFEYYKSVYLQITADFSSYVTHILLLIIVLSIVFVVSEFYNLKNLTNYKIKKWPFLAIFIFSFLLLACGNRTSASFLLLSIAGIYTMLFKNVKFKYMFIIVLVAIVAMAIVGSLRNGSEVEITSSIESAATVAVDLTLPSRNNYVVYEYVNSFGLSYGKSMINSIIAIIPFASSFLPVEDSATLLTKFYYSMVDDPNEIGLGTTVNADLYMAFGIFGVILFMYLLGRFVSKSYLMALSNDYYGLLFVALLMAFSVYLVRAPYLFPLRYCVYSYMLAYYIRNREKRNPKVAPFRLNA